MEKFIKNIYCDESCHLEKYDNDQRIMVIGAISCPDYMKEDVFKRLKDIKKSLAINVAEMKWIKASTSKKEAYKNFINYFFDKDGLSFRAIVIDKDQLNHENFSQNHDTFYYKMYFLLLDWFMEIGKTSRIYLDIKDTNGISKINKLKEVICNSNHDFDQKMISDIQEVRSHEVVVLQLVDLFIGAIGYANRYPNGGRSKIKNELVELMKSRSKCSLTRSTVAGEKKFNIFCWKGK